MKKYCLYVANHTGLPDVVISTKALFAVAKYQLRSSTSVKFKLFQKAAMLEAGGVMGTYP